MATREVELTSLDDSALNRAFANTEAELLASAFDQEAEDLPSYQPDPDEIGDRSLEDVSGWDGDPLTVGDMAQGTNENGYDRPLSLVADEALTAQIAERDELIAAQQARMAELEQRADPELRQRMEKQREETVIRMISDPNATLSHIATLEQQIVGLQANRFNEAMAALHHTEGRRAAQAYGALTSLDPRNPVVQSVARAIYSDPDPGRALMDWYGSTGARSPAFMGGAARRDAMRMPSLNGQSGGSRGAADGGSRRNSGGDSEADIFSSVEF